MNSKAMYNLTYGLFLLTAQQDGRDNGCIINTAVQVANEPTRISVSVINTNLTCDMIKATGEFNVTALTTKAPFALFQRFGMHSGRAADKFDGFSAAARSENGLLYLTEASNAYLSCRVVSATDLGSHTLFIAEVTAGEVLSADPSVTYAYYQSDIKPKPAKTAAKTTWVCSVCGYVYEGEELPEDFECPLCHHGKADFVRSGGEPVKSGGEPVKAEKYVCPVCGYVHEGKPAEGFRCPTCGVDGSKFTPLTEGKLASEHEFGVYGATVADNENIPAEDKAYILDQLKANFAGECSEVGMYLCMARVAHREGYPEIGLYWEKAAFEEAEHAAKFAELLGSVLEPNMTASTRKNLAWRVDCEFGATQGKTELAKVAKKYGLDAIHDTVHEMARDEARHGKALAGLLNRYFAKEIAREKAAAAASKAAEKATDTASKAAGVVTDTAVKAAEVLSETAAKVTEKIREMLKK